MNLVIGLIAITIASLLYTVVAFDRSYGNKPIISYFLANLAAFISVSAWMFLVRQTKSEKEIFVLNVLWDIGVTLMVVLFPILMYNFKLDTKTAIGCSIAVIGIVIAKI